ncbi:MAG TPA: chemotaxis protein CheW [Acidisphaera sp.]|nr:chemotaxis protein CheW [Acidisphaera sp.]
MPNETTAPQSAPAEYITFRVGEQEFCIGVMFVREIRSWTHATRLPHAPGFVRGVINLRGMVLPIIDLAARLGFADAAGTSAQQVIIVVQVERTTVGLLVDSVSDIVSFDEDRIQPTPEICSELARSFVSGIIPIDNRPVGLLAIDRVAPAAPSQAA